MSISSVGSPFQSMAANNYSAQLLGAYQATSAGGPDPALALWNQTPDSVELSSSTNPFFGGLGLGLGGGLEALSPLLEGGLLTDPDHPMRGFFDAIFQDGSHVIDAFADGGKELGRGVADLLSGDLIGGLGGIANGFITTTTGLIGGAVDTLTNVGKSFVEGAVGTVKKVGKFLKKIF